jgi:hypothetical protein
VGLAAEGARTGAEYPPAGLRTEEARVAERRVEAVRTEEAEVRVAVAPVQAVPAHLVQGEAATANLESHWTRLWRGRVWQKLGLQRGRVPHLRRSSSFLSTPALPGWARIADGPPGLDAVLGHTLHSSEINRQTAH